MVDYKDFKFEVDYDGLALPEPYVPKEIILTRDVGFKADKDFEDWHTQHWARVFSNRVHEGTECSDVSIIFLASWWQKLKYKLFPKWLLKRYPLKWVKYRGKMDPFSFLMQEAGATVSEATIQLHELERIE
jgi:hypothetical protein